MLHVHDASGGKSSSSAGAVLTFACSRSIDFFWTFSDVRAACYDGVVPLPDPLPVQRTARALCPAVVVLAMAVHSPAGISADPAKTLRVAFSIAETSFDPAFATDAASDAVMA